MAKKIGRATVTDSKRVHLPAQETPPRDTPPDQATLYPLKAPRYDWQYLALHCQLQLLLTGLPGWLHTAGSGRLSEQTVITLVRCQVVLTESGWSPRHGPCPSLVLEETDRLLLHLLRMSDTFVELGQPKAASQLRSKAILISGLLGGIHEPGVLPAASDAAILALARGQQTPSTGDGSTAPASQPASWLVQARPSWPAPDGTWFFVKERRGDNAVLTPQRHEALSFGDRARAAEVATELAANYETRIMES